MRLRWVLWPKKRHFPRVFLFIKVTTWVKTFSVSVDIRSLVLVSVGEWRWTTTSSCFILMFHPHDKSVASPGIPHDPPIVSRKFYQWKLENLNMYKFIIFVSTKMKNKASCITWVSPRRKSFHPRGNLFTELEAFWLRWKAFPSKGKLFHPGENLFTQLKTV